MTILRLSKREREIIEFLILGKTTRQIASLLGISPRTVETYVARSYQKLGVNCRASAVASYIQNVQENTDLHEKKQGINLTP